MQTLSASLDPAERRIRPRYRTTYGSTCVLMPSHQHGLVWDMSAEGLGMLLPSPPAPGDIVTVALEADEIAASLAVRIRVEHVRLLETGDFFVGARFLRRVTASEMEPFVTPPPGPTGRGGLRRPGVCDDANPADARAVPSAATLRIR
jgi:hypothetical protein